MSDPIKIVIEVTREGDEYNAEVLHTTKGRPATLLATGDTPGVALKALGLRIDEGLIAQAWDLNVREAVETAFAHVVPPLDSVREAVMPYRWRNISVGSRSHRDLAFGVKVYLPHPGPPGVITRTIDAIDIRDPLLEFDTDLAVLYCSGKEVPEDKHYAMRIALERRAFYVSWHSPSGYWVNGDGEPFSDVEQARLERVWYQGTSPDTRDPLTPEIISLKSTSGQNGQDMVGDPGPWEARPLIEARPFFALGRAVESSEHSYTGTIVRKITTPDDGTWWCVKWDMTHPRHGLQEHVFDAFARGQWFDEKGILSRKATITLNKLWPQIKTVVDGGVCNLPPGFEGEELAAR